MSESVLLCMRDMMYHSTTYLAIDISRDIFWTCLVVQGIPKYAIINVTQFLIDTARLLT